MEHDPLQKHYEQAYGRHADAARVAVALRLLKKSARFAPGQRLRILDIGGGDMQLGRLFAARLEAQFGVQADLACPGSTTASEGRPRTPSPQNTCRRYG